MCLKEDQAEQMEWIQRECILRVMWMMIGIGGGQQVLTSQHHGEEFQWYQGDPRVNLTHTEQGWERQIAFFQLRTCE